MKIHFLTTRIVDATGGAKYDYNFFGILKDVYGDQVVLYDDKTVKSIMGKKNGDLISFNLMYKALLPELLDCDILFMNSRLYTRFALSRFENAINRNPNVKVVVIHHHNNYLSHYGLSRLIHKELEMRIIKLATQLIIPNIYIIDLLKKELNNPNIIYLESSFEKKKYQQSNLSNKKILFVGNVQERKGLIYGLKAFRELNKLYPDYIFQIAGKYLESDKYFLKLVNYIKKEHLSHNVRFLGRVSDEELDTLYSNSDVFLFPSLLEGYGWVMIEAMGRGVPVIAFDNSAMPYTVKDMENGLLIENLNWKEMGNALIRLAEDPHLLKKLQDGALNTFHKVPSQEELNSNTKEYLINLKITTINEVSK